MSRHFYLPLQKPARAAAQPKLRWKAVPVWLRVALPAAVAVVAGILVLELAGVWPQRSPSGIRSDATASRPRDVVTQPADSGWHPIEEPAPVAAVANTGQPEKAIRLQVLNGCGVKGLAKVVSPVLRAKGFDVRETRNASHFRYARTVVLDRIGRLDLAYAVADSLGIDRSLVSTEISRNLVDIDVTLIVGSDYVTLGLSSTR